MKAKKIIVIFLFLINGFLYGQNDTTIYLSDRDEYEIKFWTNFNGVDTFLTVTFIPSTKIIPFVESRVSKNAKNGKLIYEYKISNSIESQQSIEFFLLEIDTSVFYNNATGNDWHFLRSGRLDGCSWFGDELLEPATAKDSFAIKSSNLPGIGNAYLQGQLPFYTLSEEELSFYLETMLDSLSSFPKNFVQKKTLVPVELPEPFIPKDFIDTLISYTNQSYSLSWIKDKKDEEDHEDEEDGDDDEKDKDNKIVNKLLKHLEKAKKQLEKEKIKNTVKELEKFVKRVEKYFNKNEKREKKEREEGAYLTSEAYALLKYNAEYLIEQLEGHKKHE